MLRRMKTAYFFCLIIGMMLIPLNSVFANKDQNTFIVALDGSGDYKTIQEAVTACGAFSSTEKKIFIKNGVYKEKVLIDSFHANISLIGESEDKTIITYNNYAGQDFIGTFTSYTLKILGDHIKIENLTVENSAGRVGQAVALHVEGDYFVAQHCRLLGNQDTLYAAGNNSRQYFKECFIAGTTDYIFGSATAVFDKCEIHSITDSYITAANTPKENQFGFVFFDCVLTAEPDVKKVFLGRPWREYANVVFIRCFMGKHIAPEGWHNWDKPEKEGTTFFAEIGNTGPGADVSKRVKWAHNLKKSQVAEFELNKIFKVESKWSLDTTKL
jgi:pectinesterase